MAWGQYRSITIDETLCGTADSSNFSVLVAGTYTYLKTIANGGKVENANGYDIAFYSDSALTTLLDFERRSWSATTGVVEFWVEVPTLSTSANTVIYIAYGNASQSTDLQNVTGTWNSNFKGVYHLDEDPSGSAPQMQDSTSNNYDLTARGATWTSDKSVTAKIGKGVNIDLNVSTVNLSYLDSTFSSGGATLTMSLWGKLNNTTGESYYVARSNTQTEYCILSFNSGSSGKLRWYMSWGYGQADTTTINSDNYFLIHAVYNGTLSGNAKIQIYVNGSAESMTVSGTPPATLPTFVNGHAVGNDTMDVQHFGNALDGIADEAHFLDSALTQSWITAEYNNQNSPSTFYAVGDETAVGGGTIPTSARVGIYC